MARQLNSEIGPNGRMRIAVWVGGIHCGYGRTHKEAERLANEVEAAQWDAYMAAAERRRQQEAARNLSRPTQSSVGRQGD